MPSTPAASTPDPTTLEEALQRLKLTSQARFLMRPGSEEYSATLKKEVQLSKAVYELARETRLRAVVSSTAGAGRNEDV